MSLLLPLLLVTADLASDDAPSAGPVERTIVVATGSAIGASLGAVIGFGVAWISVNNGVQGAGVSPSPTNPYGLVAVFTGVTVGTGAAGAATGALLSGLMVDSDDAWGPVGAAVGSLVGVAPGAALALWNIHDLEQNPSVPAGDESCDPRLAGCVLGTGLGCAGLIAGAGLGGAVGEGLAEIPPPPPAPPAGAAPATKTTEPAPATRSTTESPPLLDNAG